jgi:hypothetical protein
MVQEGQRLRKPSWEKWPGKTIWGKTKKNDVVTVKNNMREWVGARKITQDRRKFKKSKGQGIGVRKTT